MNKKQFETLFYSTVGVVAIFLIVVAVNFISTRAKVRADFTAEKAYTLSQGTREILSKLEEPITIRFYYTQRETAMPVPFKNYAQQVEDLLDEYRQQASDKIEIVKLDPQPDSDAEDSAHLDDVEGQMLPSGDRIYLGLSISQGKEKSAIPFLSPQREKLLEYDITRAITRVINPERPVIGIMTPMQVFGTPAMMRRFNQGGASEPWVFIDELKRDFTVKQIPITADTIDNDIKVLMVIHPKEIGDAAQYAIDQFVMRGGKLIALLDPNCYFDNQNQNPMQGGGPSSSNLEKVLKAWGIQFETGKVAADMTFASMLGQGQLAPTVLSINPDGLNKDDVVTGQIDSMLIPFPGVFQGKPADGLKQTVLLKTTKNAQLVDGFLAAMGPDAINKDFKAAGTEYPVAIRLTGKFKTAFPDGKPSTGEKKDDKDTKKDEGTLKETKDENAVILVGDADFLNDAVSVQVQNFFGNKIVIPQNGNLTFIQSAVEQLGGDSRLITVRSRATLNRPFTLVKQMEAKARGEFQDQLKQMEDSLQETQRKLSELQQQKSKDQRMILSAEQQREVENFRKKEAETNKKLKELRKNLNREVDSLQTRLKWQNILIMPVVVAISGIALAVFKRKRTSAK